MELNEYIRCGGRGCEAHELELKAMDDPFLDEALDGLQTVGGDHLSVVARLRERIATSARTRRQPLLLRILCGAAAVLLTGVAGVLYMLQPALPDMHATTPHQSVTAVTDPEQPAPPRREKQNPKAVATETTASSPRIAAIRVNDPIALEPILIVGFLKPAKWEFVGSMAQKRRQESSAEPIPQQPGAPSAPLHPTVTEYPSESQPAPNTDEIIVIPPDPVSWTEETECAEFTVSDTHSEYDCFTSAMLPDDLPDSNGGG